MGWTAGQSRAFEQNLYASQGAGRTSVSRTCCFLVLAAGCLTERNSVVSWRKAGQWVVL